MFCDNNEQGGQIRVCYYIEFEMVHPAGLRTILPDVT